MKKHCVVGLAAAGLLGSLSVAAADLPVGLMSELSAASANASLGEQAGVVDRLVGTWEVEYTDFGKDGKATHRTGKFIVGWIMDGRALQDLWIVNPSGTRKDREVYTDLLWFDPKSRTWHSAFVDPEHGSLARFTGGPVGDDGFVLETQDLGSKQTRWSISNLRSDSFAWRDEASNDGGKTWTLQAEYRMKRRGTAPTTL